MGFTFAIPFTPYFIQTLGVTDPQEIKAWVAICFAATPLSLAVFAPVWGALGDRYGRRLMLLRANFAAALIVTLMGMARSVQALVALRFLQGAFTGTMTAAQTMIAVEAPRDRSGLALGSLSAAVFSGAMVGSSIGGFVADALGYRIAFFVGGAILLCAGLLVLFGSKESFVPPEAVPEPLPLKRRLRGIARSVVPPILLLVVCVAAVRQFDTAFLPLLVQDLHGGLAGASRWTGGLTAVSGLAGLLSGFAVGRLADRLPPARVASLAALGAGLFMGPHALARSVAVLFPFRFGMMFFAGALDPVLQIWLARVTARERRGLAFGWAATAKAIGWLNAPLLSGAVASLLSVRAIFIIGAGLFFALVPLVRAIVKYVDRLQAAGSKSP